MPCSRTMSSIVAMAASPASHTACAWLRPNLFTRSLRRVSVTIVRCALVCPVSIVAQRPRSSTRTRLPAFARRYAAVRPVIPPPTTTTSVSASSPSLANCGNVVEVDQYGVVLVVTVGIVILSTFRRMVHHAAPRRQLPNEPPNRGSCRRCHIATIPRFRRVPPATHASGTARSGRTRPSVPAWPGLAGDALRRRSPVVRGRRSAVGAESRICHRDVRE